MHRSTEMDIVRLPLAVVCAGSLAIILAGCPNNSTTGDAAPDAAAMDALVDGASSCYTAAALPDGAIPTGTPGISCLPASFLQIPAPPFTQTTNTPGTINVTISGENLAELGYQFQCSPGPNDAVFLDGWSITYDRWLTIVDNVRLNLPGQDPTMQGSVGTPVAQTSGPWVVNVHKHGIIAGKAGPPETAIPLFIWTGPNQPGQGQAFDPTINYAFSFDNVPAAYSVQNVNLDASDIPYLELMIQHGWTKFFMGTAIYGGQSAGNACASISGTTGLSCGSGQGTSTPPVNYPMQVNFAYGVASPSSYINCQNPDLMQLPSGDYPTGIPVSMTGATIAQVTFHTDHFFWDESGTEGNYDRFDAWAARAEGFGTMPGGSLNLTQDDLASVNPAALTDVSGNCVPDRAGATLEAMDNVQPPVYSVGPSTAPYIRDFRDFTAYDGRTQGHLNSNGLCFVQPARAIHSICFGDYANMVDCTP